MRSIDDELRTQFHALRAEDADHAPRFAGAPSARRTAASALSPRTSRSRTVAWWFAAAAGIVIAATLLVKQASREAAERAPVFDAAPRSDITAWRSPTRGLLDMARRSTLVPPPAFGSVLDGLVAPATHPDTRQRGGL